MMTELPNQVELKIQNRTVKVKAWLYDYQSPTGGLVSVLFLDTDVEGNSPEDREITCFLYGGDREYRLKQEIVLGIGGVKMLEAAGFQIGKYHMNEGHSGLLTLELLTKNGNDLDSVRDLCIFTTHTPVEAGHDKFSYEPCPKHVGRNNSSRNPEEAWGRRSAEYDPSGSEHQQVCEWGSKKAQGVLVDPVSGL